ncbi:large conductance mechanosensitive channel protein MscL [Peptoniphilus stercorisuis]|uniref:Large-conductance mechanosensitive channel n=1 Tax=Peptoniphilus stercorisuis TaxID=1436965 RepID=A0ABS4KCW9_9FIRM|nr:large conductance mechanosensitive channel protein MscL [Peptoniphilus stercorisuis]MBP2025619.1 large conductance mechanosensitive channel [Peptoniphilus stercorisuis]
MGKFVSDFKAFIAQGNVIDMAVGVIIGGAFGKIVTSLVEDIIMPVISRIIGTVDFTDIVVKMGTAENAPVLKLGNFIQNTVNFLIIALVIFTVIRQMNRVTAMLVKEEETAPTTKECPFCKSSIAIDATRCPNCTSELN